MINVASEKLIIEKIIDNIENVIIGKRNVIELCLIGLLAEGHILFEDVPGVGKTMLIRALSKSIDCEFKRIQFTSDLLPTDVTGASIYNPKEGEFFFRGGPILSNLVLADEINRASPKTQSALLEGMGEGSLTVDGTTHLLKRPFLVFATQNPIDYEGTSPLPEAELDRFLLKVHLDYPSLQDEIEILQRNEFVFPIDTLENVVSKDEIIELQNKCKELYISKEMFKYIASLSQSTRTHHLVSLGISPRGTIALMKASKARALLQGRGYVTPDDVQYVLPYVFNHRLILKQEALFQQISPMRVVREIISNVTVPITKEFV